MLFIKRFCHQHSRSIIINNIKIINPLIETEKPIKNHEKNIRKNINKKLKNPKIDVKNK